MNYNQEVLFMHPDEKYREDITRRLFEALSQKFPGVAIASFNSASNRALGEELMQRASRPFTAMVIERDYLLPGRNALDLFSLHSPATVKVVITPDGYDTKKYGSAQFIVRADMPKREHEPLVKTLETVLTRRHVMIVGAGKKDLALVSEVLFSTEDLPKHVDITVGHTETRISDFINKIKRKYFVVGSTDLHEKKGEHDVLGFLVHQGVKKTHIVAYGNEPALIKRAEALGISTLREPEEGVNRKLISWLNGIKDKPRYD